MASQRGVYTLADLHDRCRPNRETGCLTWAGCVVNGQGMLWLPEARKTTTLAFALAWILTGGHVPDRMTSGYTCGNRLCCAVKHRPMMTRKEIMRLVMPSKCTVPNLAAWARSNWSKRKITPEMADEIRASAETVHEMVRRLGVSKTTIYRHRKSGAHMTLLPGASVFSFGSLR